MLSIIWEKYHCYRCKGGWVPASPDRSAARQEVQDHLFTSHGIAQLDIDGAPTEWTHASPSPPGHVINGAFGPILPVGPPAGGVTGQVGHLNPLIHASNGEVPPPSSLTPLTSRLLDLRPPYGMLLVELALLTVTILGLGVATLGGMLLVTKLIRILFGE